MKQKDVKTKKRKCKRQQGVECFQKKQKVAKKRKNVFQRMQKVVAKRKQEAQMIQKKAKRRIGICPKL